MVSKGWHDNAVIYRAELRNGRSKGGKDYQYIKVDFEIKKVLVPAFFFHKKGQVEPDPMLGKLLAVAGLTDDFRGDQAGFFKSLIGTELSVKVIHKYKKAGSRRIRRDQIVDFEPMPAPYESDNNDFDDEENFDDSSK